MITLVCVVEGDGEVEALPVLLRRIVQDSGRFDIDLPRPLRTPRDRFLRRQDEMRKMLGYAALKAGPAGAVLVLLDADDDCIADVVAQHKPRIDEAAAGTNCALVLAKSEFEAWFVAAAESLRGYRSIAADAQCPPDAEAIRDAKGWLRRHMTRPGAAYSETVDQPAFANKFDWRLARRRSPSLDKLCRELARLLSIDALAVMS